VAAEHDDKLQVGIAACGRGGNGLRRNERGEWEKSQCEEKNSSGGAHVMVSNSQKKV
jgi:hypothetical protein